jgi:carbamoyl-phosphate synthase small subunit
MKKSNSFYQNPLDAVLVFPDGTKFYGFGIGAKGETSGEICFNTSITGYQEILTDPSYSGQIINFTFPHIGNVGVNSSDIEARQIRAKGLIVREDITLPANYRSNQDFHQFLIDNKITGISGVDTREITKKIRRDGAKNVIIYYGDDLSDKTIDTVFNKIKIAKDLNGVELASKASENKVYNWQNQGKWVQDNNSYNVVSNPKYKVVALDFGAKLNILRCLTNVGCEVVVLPATASFDDIISHKPDGVFLSNGPGDPSETGKYAIPTIQKILAQNIPLFGICLGHQLLALAVGAKTIKMSQGHRGANHPVQNILTKKVEITSQNHGFCVDKNSLPANIEITHISLFDQTIEGIKIANKPAFSVQYHPESSPGPSDSSYLFDDFIELINKYQK